MILRQALLKVSCSTNALLDNRRSLLSSLPALIKLQSLFISSLKCFSSVLAQNALLISSLKYFSSVPAQKALMRSSFSSYSEGQRNRQSEEVGIVRPGERQRKTKDVCSRYCTSNNISSLLAKAHCINATWNNQITTNRFVIEGVTQSRQNLLEVKLDYKYLLSAT